MFKKKERNFQTIVAPLSTIETDLATYISEQEVKKAELEVEKEEINTQITTSRLEKKKSEHTVVKIAELLGSNFTESDLDDEEEKPIELEDQVQPESTEDDKSDS